MGRSDEDGNEEGSSMEHGVLFLCLLSRPRIEGRETIYSEWHFYKRIRINLNYIIYVNDYNFKSYDYLNRESIKNYW